VQALLHLADSIVRGVNPIEKRVQDVKETDSKQIAITGIKFSNFPRESI
jgi:hypothetical protein